MATKAFVPMCLAGSGDTSGRVVLGAQAARLALTRLFPASNNHAVVSSLEDGDMAGAETWHRILNAIERLQARAPAEGEKVH
jgi:hypothetical protein